jgi:hypothetical protein
MIPIYDSKSKAILKAAVLVSTLLLCAVAMSFGQQKVNLTAGPTTTTMPDGTVIPMWGYTCGAAVTTSSATCAPLSGSMSGAATGALGGLYVLSPGSGYLSPTVTISGGGGTGATASAVVSGGQIVGFNVMTHGSGYTSAPMVTISDSGPGTGAVAAAAPAWSPVVITVPYGAVAGGLQINLTNNLSFPSGSVGGTTANNIPTSIVIVGQVGGGLGGTPTTTQSPDHSNAQGCVSWFIAANPPGTPCTSANNQGLATPPTQANRVQSMGTEVAAVAAGTSATSTPLTWANLKPGTYLLESGTHPSIQVPMGLIGMLVVTNAPGTVTGSPLGMAYGTAASTHTTAAIAQVTYNAEAPFEFSEIDPVQNKAVDQAVRTSGFSESAVWTRESGGGPVTSIAVSAGGSGYTISPIVTINGNGSGATAIATLTAGSVSSITITNAGDGYSSAVGSTTVSITPATGDTGSGATATATVMIGGCGGGAHTCYPPAVNYTPFYFLINGLAFDKANPGPSLFPATAGVSAGNPVRSGITGTILVRLVNAGLRMHVPAIVGSQTTGYPGTGTSTSGQGSTKGTVQGFTLIAEDGNPIPANTTAPRVKTEVFMAAGKTFDVMINGPATGTTVPPSLPIYDREGSLSANSSVRDAGMVAYLGVNGSLLPVSAGTGVFANAKANLDTYASVIPCKSTSTSCTPLVITDPSKGVIANDVNVYGVELSSQPSNGTLTCSAAPGSTVGGICANGTFTYTPNPGATAVSTTAWDTFGYCANGASAPNLNLCTTVTLNLSSLLTAGTPSAIAQIFTAKTASYLKISSPGLLLGNTDPSNLPLNVVVPSTPPTVTLSGGATTTGTATVVIDANGGFVLSIPGNTSAGTASFSYTVQNSQGIQSPPSTVANVTVTLPQPSNLQVNVLDAQAYNSCNGDSGCISNLVKNQAFPDYRWIIEEDKTFWVDPNCTTNSSTTTSGCPSVVGPAGQSTIPTFGVNFHTSNMDYVAQGCTGPLSCEAGQTILDTRPMCTTPPVGSTPGVPTGCSMTAGMHVPAVCDVGNGACRPDPNCTALPCSAGGTTPVFPSQVALDPSKRYYISVLPGDAANPFPTNVSAPACNGLEAQQGDTTCGHTMSGAPIPPACNVLVAGCTSASTAAFQPVNVLVLPTPLPTGKLSVLVFEDDYPLNGEQDGGGGAGGAIAPVEPGLGGFNIVLWDTYGGLGDVTGQNSYDMFNQPLSNSLTGTVDPTTGLDACPISAQATQDPTQAGITGVIVTCPKYESDGHTLSPLAGQAVIANLMPEKFSVQAYPGADRIARGEEWIQTNTLDGQHPHDSFIRIGEPSYFQEYGPAGYHVMIGFANPAIINARHTDVCNGAGSPGAVGPCTNTVDGQVDVQRLSRIPDERLYPSGSRDALAWTQCWVSLGDPDGEDFMFTKCDANGNFRFTSVPSGNWRLTIGDQWNDQIIDGLSTAANVGCSSYSSTNGNSGCSGGQTLHMGNIGVQQWQANLYTRTFIDDNKNGVFDDGEIGIPLIYTMIHYRDGHNANALTTDFNGIAPFNETFPLFNWYVVEADSTRYKTTGIHTVYDAGGPADGTSFCGSSGARACGTSTAYKNMSNTSESVPLPADLSVPGAVYCAKADCTAEATADFMAGTAVPSSSTASTGRIDPPWVTSEGWAGLTGHSNWIDFGKAPYASCNPSVPASATNFCTTVTVPPPPGSVSGTKPTTIQVGENGGIYGTVVYASTRPFDDASQMIQQPWQPYVPNVTVNLYQEGFASDGVTPTLTMVDTTVTSSWDAWAQGFYPGSAAGQSAVGAVTIASGGGGTGYKVGDTIGLTGGNGGGAAVTVATISGTGTITAVTLLDGGSGYTSAPTVDTTLSGTGSGAILTATLLPAAQADGKPYMSCPGQGTATSGPNQDLFYFTLFDQPNYLDWYNSVHSNGAQPIHPLPYNSQFKCYDAMKINNQIQPAPYDGKYVFPSSLGIQSSGTFAGKLVTTVGSTNGVTASMAGTNCTICVANPDSTDVHRVGTPMLPPGKYVVEVIMPPGYEVEKEEDKNLLIGDNFIAPVSQQFGGLGGDIFILPDQASVASMYDESGAGYNGTNYQNSTTGEGLADQLVGTPGFPGYTDPLWPCVGEMRVVPDYLSLFPGAQETAPFAGATRPLCDRKEITLTNQMAANARFFIFTSTHIASKYTGVITDDFTSEFDPFSPQFGEKFAPPNMPISTKDYLGNELSRVYSDHWGIYDGLTFSSWDVNPPNITGYSPSMMTQCMNDPGPVLDTNPNSKTYGQLIQDPLYNSAYSDFCYEEPYMPGLTTYLDTPVVPTEGFVGAGYNNPDCSYPDATPAVAEVDGDGIGPWVSAAGKTLTITALGDIQVNNNAYSGPSANAAPFSSKTITRHYGFGTTQGTGSVTIGGQLAAVSGWNDSTITVTVPNGVPNCSVQQQTQYGGSTAQCGQLLITAGNGKQSIDSVTVTIGGKTPTHVDASSTIQSAIDAAAPGDLIIVDPTCSIATGIASCSTTAVVTGKAPAAHNEMLLMWKPVRLQGVGAGTSIIDSNSFPAGKLLDPWRRHVNCLFGLTLSGVPLGSPIPVPGTSNTTPAVYDPSGSYNCPDAGWKYFGNDLTGTGAGTPVANVPQVDRIPLEAVLGWDATLNGNLAEQLQEPSLMGAYEGAGITVISKGVSVPPGVSAFGTEGAFPTGALLLQDTPAFLDSTGAALGPQVSHCADATNPYPSNFMCNPSSIDGLTVRDSSQGGGGIFIHGWGHNLQVANNRVYNNAGTLSGGITVGQAEFPDAITVTGVLNGVGEQSALDVLPSCQNSTVVGTHLPYCLDLNVNLHNNAITSNSSLGDELFSGTLSGGGGASFCTGADYYKFNYNWVCGNISAAEGGGITHLGFMYNGDIEHNTIALNESSNPTIPTNGGGIMVMGTPDTDPTCAKIPDADCPAGLSDGTGPNLVINANLIQANGADSGAGGGIRLQQVNGTDVSTFNTDPTKWNNVSVTNNIIVNNIAGWDGAGISLQDSLNVIIRNNTIASNDTLSSSGVLTQSIGTPDASAPAGSCIQTGPTGANTASCPQPSGVSSTPNSSVLTTTFVVPITCPTGSPNCKAFSNPLLQNNVIWQNRSFYIGITGSGTGPQNQQNQVGLFNAFTGTAAPTQSAFGACGSGVSYWDVGVRGDRTVTGHESGFKLNPTYSVLDDTGYDGSNMASNPSFTSQYCNGSRVPPTCSVADGCGGPSGYGVPPGIVDASTPNPKFTLNPSATVDEGNNWVNVSWGPLALSDDSVQGTDGNYGGGAPFANYALNLGSMAIDYVPTSQPYPSTDFFGNPRPDATGAATFDVGAIEYQKALPNPTLTAISPNFGYRGHTVPVTLTGTNLTGATAIHVSGTGITVSGLTVVNPTTITATFTLANGATLGAQTVTVTTGNGSSNGVTFTVDAATLSGIAPTHGTRNTSVNVSITGVGLLGSTGVTVSGSGVTVSNFAVASDTQVTATFTIGSGAGLGAARNVTVAAPGGNTNAVPFTIVAPALTAISPSSGARGASVNVNLTGTNLTGSSAPTVSGAGVTVSNYTVTSATSATATFNIANSAGPSARTVSIPGNNGTVTFTVLGGTATFTGPTPALTTGGASGTATRTGTITLTYAGGTAPLIITGTPSITKVGTAGGTFSLTGGTCGSTVTIPATGGSCTLTVQYVPGGSTATATANVTVPNTGGSNATSPNFTAN